MKRALAIVGSSFTVLTCAAGLGWVVFQLVKYRGTYVWSGRSGLDIVRGAGIIFIWLLALAVAGRWLARLRQRSRAEAGRCVRCGYDLRATPELCPECGAIALL